MNTVLHSMLGALVSRATATPHASFPEERRIREPELFAMNAGVPPDRQEERSPKRNGMALTRDDLLYRSWNTLKMQ